MVIISFNCSYRLNSQLCSHRYRIVHINCKCLHVHRCACVYILDSQLATYCNAYINLVFSLVSTIATYVWTHVYITESVLKTCSLATSIATQILSLFEVYISSQLLASYIVTLMRYCSNSLIPYRLAYVITHLSIQLIYRHL